MFGIFYGVYNVQYQHLFPIDIGLTVLLLPNGLCTFSINARAIPLQAPVNPFIFCSDYSSICFIGYYFLYKIKTMVSQQSTCSPMFHFCLIQFLGCGHFRFTLFVLTVVTESLFIDNPEINFPYFINDVGVKFSREIAIYLRHYPYKRARAPYFVRRGKITISKKHIAVSKDVGL